MPRWGDEMPEAIICRRCGIQVPFRDYCADCGGEAPALVDLAPAGTKVWIEQRSDGRSAVVRSNRTEAPGERECAVIERLLAEGQMSVTQIGILLKVPTTAINAQKKRIRERSKRQESQAA